MNGPEQSGRPRELLEAEEAYRAALVEDGSDGTALRGLAALLAVTGRADEAVVLLRTRLRQEPEDALARRALGMALCRQAGLENALERKQVLFGEAVEALQHAVQTTGWDQEVASYLAASLAALGRRGEALRALAESLDHIKPPAARLRIYGEALLYQVMWDLTEEAMQTARLMRHEATNEQAAFTEELMRLAGEARRMAVAGPPWSVRALALASLLEELAP